MKFGVELNSAPKQNMRFSSSLQYAIKPNQTKSYIFDRYVKRGFGIRQPTIVDMPQKQTKPNHTYLIYMCKEDLALNNLK